jgi:hypothetical protein
LESPNEAIRPSPPSVRFPSPEGATPVRHRLSIPIVFNGLTTDTYNSKLLESGMDYILKELSRADLSPVSALSHQIAVEGRDERAVYQNTKRLVPLVYKKLNSSNSLLVSPSSSEEEKT